MVLSISLLLPFVSPGQQSIHIENRRELFLDNHILEKFDNTELRLGTPVSGGVALKFDELWEGRFSGGYVSVVNDGKLFRIYYRGVGEGQGALGQVTCYAESADGIKWTKPDLNLFVVKGSSRNNVVMTGNIQQSTHNLSVIYDSRGGVPVSERYKAVGGVASSVRPGRGLYRYVSPDGIHWKRYSDSSALFING